MGVFGEFVYSEDLYGTAAGSEAIELLTPKLLGVRLEVPAILNSSFSDTSNYTVSLITGSGPVAVRSILVPQDGSSATDIILIELDSVTEGSLYEVSITGLTGTNGQSLAGAQQFYGRRTKAGNMIKALPSHFDKTPRSTISNLLTAIGLSDDRIGGSRSDDLE